MGCFSFICQKSKRNVQEGDAVYLFLLKNGVVIEEQYGKYNTYGNVEGHEWKMDWSDVCQLMFTGGKSNGIAAVLADKYKGTPPTTQSEDDPKQGTGWRKKIELTEEPYHKIYER
jgi:hypothetical protein